jgi:superfamily II DNA or RNA helicase
MGVAQLDMFAPAPSGLYLPEERAPRIVTGSGLKARPYQEDAFTGVRTQLRDNRSTLLVLPTGSGKTFIFSRIAHDWPERDYAQELSQRVLVLAHRDELLQQARQRIAKETGELVGLEQAEARAGLERIVVGSVQTLCQPDRLGGWKPDAFGLVICDEAHHGPSPSYKRIFEHFASAKLLGVTATPDRADEKAMGQVFESVAYVYEIEDAISDAWLVPIRVRQVFIDAIKLAACRTTAGDLNQGDLDAAMAVEEALHGVVNATIEQAGDRKTIVYTTSVDNATRLAEIFNRYQPGTARDVNGKTPMDIRRGILAGFERGDFQRLVNCGIATEGFDCLDSETEILTTSGWSRREDLHPGENLWAYDRRDGIPKRVPMDRLVVRRVEPGERMLSIVGQHVNIRTTEGHEFHIKHRTRSGLSNGFETRTGREIAQRRSAYALPLCGSGAFFPGVDLEDDEIRFVAWFMTDGGFEGHRLCISQSKDTKDRIRQLLRKLGLSFRERVRLKRKGAYPNAKPLHVFSVPKGNHGGSLKRNGWGRLEAYLDKNVSVMLSQMTERQFSLFWSEALLGDSSRQKGKAGWLWCSKEQADAYTAMAVVRGFSASCARQVLPSGKDIYRVSVRDAKFLTCDPADPRAAKHTLSVPEEGEEVWCATNELSTLFVRRNGKIAVIGNCPPVSCIAQARPTKSRSLHAQIVGRGLRTVYAPGFDLETVEGRRQAIAEGPKKDCLVLEFTGNSGKHKLASSVDILGGRYDEDEVERAKKIVEAKPGMRADEALAVAHLEAEKRRADEAAKRARLMATTKYSTRDFSPFDVLHLGGDKQDEWSERFGGAVATDGQLSALDKFGVDIPKGCTKTQAHKLLDACFARAKIGLARYKQVKLIERYGIQAINLSMDKAGEVIDAIKSAGWKRPSAEVVDRIINRERQAGE